VLSIRLWIILVGLLAGCGSAVAQHKSSQPHPDTTFVIARPEDVEDVALLDREFGTWNFGSGILLEAGYMPGLYELHHAATLIRFNLSGSDCDKVRSATLRLYKPECTIQMAPIQVQVHRTMLRGGKAPLNVPKRRTRVPGMRSRTLSSGRAHQDVR